MDAEIRFQHVTAYQEQLRRQAAEARIAREAAAGRRQYGDGTSWTIGALRRLVRAFA